MLVLAFSFLVFVVCSVSLGVCVCVFLNYGVWMCLVFFTSGFVDGF